MTSFGPILAILEQHSDEAAFLWNHRSRAVNNIRCRLKDLCGLDSRLEAHIDGLRIASQAAWDILRNALQLAGPGELFVASVLAFETEDPSWIEIVLDLAGSSTLLARGTVSGLGWLPANRAALQIARLLESSEPILHCIGLAAATVHGLHPSTLAIDVVHGDARVRAQAYRNVGEIGADFELDLNDEDEQCRFWAAWSASRRRDRVAIRNLIQFAIEGNAHAEEAANTAMRVLDLSSAISFHRDLAATRVSITAAASLGDVQLIPFVLGQMKVPALARKAGEAFTMITGVDIGDHLAGNRPVAFEGDPTEDPNDENVKVDPDDNLQWPDPAAAEHWWVQHAGEFAPGIRYLLGKAISIDWIHDVLRMARQGQRRAAAIELAIQRRGQPLFNVRAPGFRQQQLLERAE